MTTEPSFASLSPTLLARKGGARPAMRPQHARLQPTSVPTAATGEQLEDLGWDDMGDHEEASKPADVIKLTPPTASPEAEAETARHDAQAEADFNHVGVEPAVHRQQAELSHRIEARASDAETEPAGEPGAEQSRDAAPVTAPTPTTDSAEKSPQTAPRAARPTAQRAQRTRRSALDRGKRAAFTLRLDAERHLKLRLACTIRGASAQQLVTKALDELLADMPEIGALAAQVGAE